jgi:Stage II sporulation protein E (SpoIIE)
VVRARRLSIGLTVVGLASFAVGSAHADITVDVPGVAQVTVPTPPAQVPVPGGHGPFKVQPPSVDVPVPRSGGRPSVTVGPGDGNGNGNSGANGKGHGNGNAGGNGNGNSGSVTTPPVPTPPATPAPAAPSAPPTSDAQATAAQPTPSPATTTPAHTTAAASAPGGQSHTVAPITRSGAATPRRKPSTTPRRPVPRPTVVAPVAAPKPTAPPKAKRTPDPAPAPLKHVTKPRAPQAISAAIGEVVDRLPSWVVGVFVGFAALAIAMAIDAYVSSRRARRLAAQRAELVDDVGHLQAALLATVPATPGDVAFSVAYRPAAGLAAGGDFYDVFELDPHRTALVLGDVSGHGRESVAHAALVRYTLRTFLAAGHGPAEAIALTDPCLHGHLDGQFATVIAAIYDHAAHTITYAKAGHHPPLLLGLADLPVVKSSPPIGAGLGGRPTDQTLDVVPGATVCFFTDGLVEARRAEGPLGTERVAQMLAEAPDDAEALIAAVASEADALNDDLAVCLLHRPAEERAAQHADPLLLAEPVGA